MKKLLTLLKVCMVAVFVVPVAFVFAACSGNKNDVCTCDDPCPIENCDCEFCS
jgi:hypothetical protein